MKKLITLLMLFTFNLVRAEVPVKITYIANAGFMYSYKDKNILIDALFNNSFGEYLVPSNELKNKIIKGESPFEHVDLFLVTHNHGDHFYAPDVIDFLKNHDETILISPTTAGSQCFSEEKNISKQVRNIESDVGAAVEESINDIHIKIFRLKHLGDDDGLKTTNLAYLVNFNGIKILQMGDITIEHSKSLIEKFKWEDETIDILFVSYFDLSDVSANYIKEVIKPKKIIALHIPPKEFSKVKSDFLNVFPNGILLENSMDEISLNLVR